MFARDELTRLQNMRDQVDRKLEQLKFTNEKAAVHIEEMDLAQVPKEPDNTKRLKYMALLPLGVLPFVLGFFMFADGRARRKAKLGIVASWRPRERLQKRWPGKRRVNPRNTSAGHGSSNSS
jgi:hypothetical protein